MIVNKDKIKFGISEILSVVLSVLFLIGIKIWFPVCEPMESGFMSCHWAGEVLKAISVLLFILSVIHIFIPDENIKLGLDIGLCGIDVFAFCVPGNIISLCKMAEMNCRSNTAFWTKIFMILFILISVTDILFYLFRQSEKRHKRVKMERSI